MSEPEIRSCEEALRLLAAYLDRELEPAGAQRLERHLQVCRSCYSRADFERRLKARLAELGDEPVGRGVSDRIQALVRTFTTAGKA